MEAQATEITIPDHGDERGKLIALEEMSGTCALMSKPRILVVAHVFYPEFWPELASCIRNIAEPVTLVVTYSEERSVAAARRDFPAASFVWCENVGFDIWPFVKVLQDTDLTAYDIVVKLHTKRDVEDGTCYNGVDFSGSRWRRQLLSFCATPHAWHHARRLLSRKSTGMVAALGTIFDSVAANDAHGVFWEALADLSAACGWDFAAGRYVAGAMFAARAEALRPLLARHFESSMFSPSVDHSTRTYAHVVERELGLSVAAAGKRIVAHDGSVFWRKIFRLGGDGIPAYEKYQFSRVLNGRFAASTVFYHALAKPYRLPLLPFALMKAYFRRRREGLPVVPPAAAKGTIRPIALYLPQFHRFPENDAWWGEGFTEWTNVRKARPLFKGHVEPRVPHPDIGYYDLSDVEVMRKQAAMAKKYGIYGFCFYYYHFKDGKRLLEKPLDNWLAAKDIDFPFCYAWANENWTRSWDGSKKDVIMPQDYSEANLMAMMRNMLKDFADPRYIKVGRGKTPVLLVYRAEEIPDVRAIAAKWRQMAQEAGFDDLHLVSMQNFAEMPPADLGFDAATEFAAWRTELGDSESRELKVADYCLRGQLLNVAQYSAHMRYVLSPDRRVDYPRYKMVCPGWDNSPRRGYAGLQLVGATPELFARCFRGCCELTRGNPLVRDNGFVFINAWNEWGEGAHLEPDVRDGYAKLKAVRETLQGDFDRTEISGLGRRLRKFSRSLRKRRDSLALSLRRLHARLVCRRFEQIVPLGMNCEVAFCFYRRWGFLDSSLFAWAAVFDLDHLANALRHFDTLYAGEVELEPRSMMWRCCNDGMLVHGRLRPPLHGADQPTADVIAADRADTLSRVRHLKDKFLRYATNDASTLFVHRLSEEDARSDHLAERLEGLEAAFSDLGARNWTLLVICERASLSRMPPGPRRIFRAVQKYNDHRNVTDPNTGDPAGWDLIFTEFAPARILKKAHAFKFE